MPDRYDVVVVGGGQAGLATGYHLRRAGLSFVILDDQQRAGGAWPHTWPSLRLFSPAGYSSLPGWLMPACEGFPTRAHVIDYLARYEQRYDLPVRRPVRVAAVHADGDGFGVDADRPLTARAVVSATGTWSQPFWPSVPGQRGFGGRQVHSAHYEGPSAYEGQRVVVVGGANSGAQIAAELSGHAEVTWCTLGPPRYLPDEVDGRELFRIANARARALAAGRADPGSAASLGDIVAVPAVREARERGLLVATDMFARFTPGGVSWGDREAPVDAVIWCTGFRPALRHLRPLALRDARGRIPTDGTRSRAHPMLHLVGYGDWTGPGSATLIGVGVTARAAVADIAARLGRVGAIPQGR